MTDYATNRDVWILGAGFSREMGFPLMADFLDCALQTLLDEETTDDERKALETLIALRLDANRAAFFVRLNAFNIEDLLSLAQAYPENISAQHSVGHAQLVAKAIAAVLSRANRLAHARHPTNPLRRILFVRESPGEQLAIRLLRRNEPGHYLSSEAIHSNDNGIDASMDVTHTGLLALLMSGHLTGRKSALLTFNYDTLIEQGLRACGIVPNLFAPIDQPEAVRRLTKCDRGFAGNAATLVLKLHGSIDWEHLPHALEQEDKLRISKIPAPAPLIVPPTWSKGNTTALLKSVWKSATESLSSANNVFIAGYSFPASDVYFRYMLASALSRNTNFKRLVIINPSPSIRDQVHRWLGQDFIESGKVAFETMTLGSFFRLERDVRPCSRYDIHISSDHVHESFFSMDQNQRLIKVSDDRSIWPHRRVL
jgi:hypothetical protein